MKTLFLWASLGCLYSLPSRAQDLAAISVADKGPRTVNVTVDGSNHEISLKKTIPWKKERDEIAGHIDHSLIKTMSGTTAAMVALLRDSCLSEGSFLPSWHGKFVSEKYSLSSRVKFTLECHFQASVPPDNTGSNADAANMAQIRITANDFTSLFRDTLYVNGKMFRTLKGQPSVKNGFPYFEYRATGDDRTDEEDTANMPQLHSKIWLVTTPDKMPYTPVTRRQYLEEASQEVKNEKGKLIAAIKEKIPIKSAEIQKAEKEKAIDEISQTYSGVEREMRVRRFLQSYKTDEDFQKEGIESGTVDIDAKLHFMDSLLTHLSAKELKEPALVSVPAINFVAFEDSLPGSTMLVQVNSAYFDPGFTVDKAQCLLVCWNYNPSEAIAADIDRQLNEKFDFKKLQDLLGK